MSGYSATLLPFVLMSFPLLVTLHVSQGQIHFCTFLTVNTKSGGGGPFSPSPYTESGSATGAIVFLAAHTHTPAHPHTRAHTHCTRWRSLFPIPPYPCPACL